MSLALSAAPAIAAAKKQGTKATGAKSDQTFIVDVAKDSMAEVELGKLAVQQAVKPEVRQFGQRMIDDHSKANEELKMLAQQKGITLPSDLDPKTKALKARLEKLSGEQFDRAFMRAMLMDHRKAVNAFKHESASGQDPDVKMWAAKTLPTLEEHLKLARDASKGAVATSGRRTTTRKK
jgi:putative membrane protein